MVSRMAAFRLTGINNSVTYCAVLGVDPTALCKLGEHSKNEQHPSPFIWCFEAGLYSIVQAGRNTITSTDLKLLTIFQLQPFKDWNYKGPTRACFTICFKG